MRHCAATHPDKHRLRNLSSEGRRRQTKCENQSLYRRPSRRLGVVVLTPSTNLDDQVAVENSAASKSLG